MYKRDVHNDSWAFSNTSVLKFCQHWTGEAVSVLSFQSARKCFNTFSLDLLDQNVLVRLKLCTCLKILHILMHCFLFGPISSRIRPDFWSLFSFPSNHETTFEALRLAHNAIGEISAVASLAKSYTARKRTARLTVMHPIRILKKGAFVRKTLHTWTLSLCREQIFVAIHLMSVLWAAFSCFSL